MIQPESGQIYDAIITFLAEDLSHGYVLLVEDPNNLNGDYIQDRKSPSFKFHPAKDTEPKKFQMVRIKVSKKKRFQLAHIVDNVFCGIKTGPATLLPVGSIFRSEKVFQVFDESSNFQNIEANVPVDFFVNFDVRRNRFKFLDPEEARSVELVNDCAKGDFEYYISKRNASYLKKAKDLEAYLVQIDKGDVWLRYQLGILIEEVGKDPEKAFGESLLRYFGNSLEGLFDYETCLTLLQGDLKKLILFWLEEIISPDVINPNVFKKLNETGEVYKSMGTEMGLSILNKVIDYPNFEKILIEWINSREEIKGEDYKKLQKFTANTKDSEISIILRKKLPFSQQLSFWKTDDRFNISDEIWIKNFADLNLEDRYLLYKRKGIDDYTFLSKDFNEHSADLIESYFEDFLLLLGKELNYCCFDLEVNPQTHEIDELAYKSAQHEKEFLNPTNEDIQTLRKELEVAELIVGHNIRKFDLPKLYRNSLPEGLKIWDTLEVEALLNPDTSSYALNTEHEALMDVKHCLRLFTSQVYRILKSEYLQKLVLTGNILPWMPNKGSKLSVLSIAEETKEEYVSKFFHSPESRVKLEFIKLIPTNVKLIVCPEPFWHYFRDIKVIVFMENEHPFSMVLEKNKISEQLHSHQYIASCLLHYLAVCATRNILPYARRLSPYLSQLIEEHLPIAQLCGIPQNTKGLTITSEWYFDQHKNDLINTLEPLDVCLFATNFWPYLSRRKLSSLDQDDLNVVNNDAAMWIKFANGRSSVPIGLEDAKKFNVPLQGNHFWVEREGLTMYSLWESFAELAEVQPFSKVDILTLKDKFSSLKESPVAYINYRNQGKANFIDLNPETLYRDLYWEIKLKTIFLLLSKMELGAKNVLLIHNVEDLETIHVIIKSLNLYSPSIKATLRRRLELLQDAHRGIMIALASDLDQILSYPQSEGISYILESLAPDDFIVASASTKESQLQNTDEDDGEVSEEEAQGADLPHYGGTFDNLSKLRDYYDWILTKILLQSKENSLLILDPRAHQKLFSFTTCKPITVDIDKLNSIGGKIYETIKEKARQLLYAPREFEFQDINEHLDKIARIFLKGKGDGTFTRPQLDYLSIIFPGKEDVLVTLPTGTGKSVLFQGPSLYRSSFTGRLSIVVTPLKALMEDHVMGLWKMGFWNTVDYINADKGNEIMDIYRKIAGGQLLMVFVTPERFRSRGFINALEHRIQTDGKLEYLVFDEAHCISQWGNEFRPDYFYCAQRTKDIRKSKAFPLLLLSATVTKQVAKNLETALYE